MNSWQLIKEIFQGIGFYWRKFIVLSIFVVLILLGLNFIRVNNQSQAAFSFSDEPQFKSVMQKNVDVTVGANGQVLVDGKTDKSALTVYKDYDEIRLLAADNPGVFIQNGQITMHLPGPVSSNQVKQITYAVHGVDSYQNYMLDNQTLVWRATDISSEATWTVVAQVPKNIIQPPLGKLFLYWISSVPAQSYLILAIILPLLTFIITLFMLLKRRKDQIVSLNVEPSAKVPEPICPAVVGVLLDGRVGAREIAATLIDLACRGHLFITRKPTNFIFGKRKSMNVEKSKDLRDFEKILLGKIFMPQDYRSTREDVEMRVGHHIFSRKIAQVFLGIYNEATRDGYFVKNPASVHRRWRYTGIALFILGLLGFAQSAVYAPDPKFTLIFWVGEILAASVIIRISGLMPARSAKGSAALGPWMALRKYLKLHKPIERGVSYEEVFVKYLTYAIVFGVEDAWAKRFLEERFSVPEWYCSYEEVTTFEDFIGGLFPLISFVGQLLAGSHEPTVE